MDLDLALSMEQELFAEGPLRIKLGRQYGPHVDGLTVEEALQELREQLLPVWERTNRQLLQNLQALRRPQPGTLPIVAIRKAGQVNVAPQQVNLQRKSSRSSQPVALL